MTDDLNQRVQAHLAALERGNTDFSDPLGAMIMRMLPSWRERWGRHQPLERWDGMNGYVSRCNTCRHAKDNEICPERLSVCREIGVQP